MITEIKNNGYDIKELDIQQIKQLFSIIQRNKQNQIDSDQKKKISRKRMITTLKNKKLIENDNISDQEISKLWSILNTENSIFRMEKTLINHNIILSNNPTDEEITINYSNFISSIQQNRSKEEKEKTSTKMKQIHNKRSKEEKDKIDNKRKKTNLKKYGQENVMQVAKIIEKAIKKSKSYKKYIMPSGRIINLQGYEDLVVDYLLKIGIHEYDIIVEKDKIPEIWYTDIDEKSRRYYPDIFIKNKNILIEVKSKFLFDKDKDTILLKQAACNNFNFKLVILFNRQSVISFNID